MIYGYRKQIDSTNRIIEQLGELKQSQLLELNKEIDNITQISRAEKLERTKFLALADCIAVENEGDAVLTLVFDCSTWLPTMARSEL